MLPDITPNVSVHVQTMGNPLADYLDALDRIALTVSSSMRAFVTTAWYDPGLKTENTRGNR